VTHKSYFKVPTFRSEAWRKAVVDIGFCVLCGKHGDIQAAHRNELKGAGIKVHDCWTAATCPACHYQIDQSKDLTRDERRALIDRAIVLTLAELVISGRVGLIK
jgi:hypothetical protein